MRSHFKRFVPQSTINRRMQDLDDRYARELRRTHGLPAVLVPEALPFVEVTIIRRPEASGPVVDVALEPKDGAK